MVIDAATHSTYHELRTLIADHSIITHDHEMTPVEVEQCVTTYMRAIVRARRGLDLNGYDLDFQHCVTLASVGYFNGPETIKAALDVRAANSDVGNVWTIAG